MSSLPKEGTETNCSTESGALDDLTLGIKAWVFTLGVFAALDMILNPFGGEFDVWGLGIALWSWFITQGSGEFCFYFVVDLYI